MQSSDDEFPLGDKIDLMIWGVFMASVFIVLGVIGILKDESPWPLGWVRFDFYGAKAIALCCFYFAIGLGLHFHYFWGILRVRPLYVYGRKGAAYLAIASLGYVLVATVGGWIDLV